MQEAAAAERVGIARHRQSALCSRLGCLPVRLCLCLALTGSFRHVTAQRLSVLLVSFFFYLFCLSSHLCSLSLSLLFLSISYPPLPSFLGLSGLRCEKATVAYYYYYNLVLKQRTRPAPGLGSADCIAMHQADGAPSSCEPYVRERQRCTALHTEHSLAIFTVRCSTRPRRGSSVLPGPFLSFDSFLHATRPRGTSRTHAGGPRICPYGATCQWPMRFPALRKQSTPPCRFRVPLPPSSPSFKSKTLLSGIS